MAINIDLKTVRIRFLDTNKFSDVEVGNDVSIQKGEFIVVKTDKGEELVLVIGFSVPDEEQTENIKFIRKATEKDIKNFEKLEEKAEKYLKICQELAEKYKLKMNLLRAYIPLNKTKVIFYYTAESRVDFRELVKDLAKRLKMRIEMKQVGVRDGVKLSGAVGMCGNTCCCSLFLDKFESVGVEILEEQNLPPTPSKFTGVCGRLMCCLAFEKDNYTIRKNLPEIGKEIIIDNKLYKVKGYDFIKEIVEFYDEENKVVDFSFDYLDTLNLIQGKSCSSCESCPSANF
jgi:cell fate regulator YaaT (PSP1 superfamily)